MLFRSERRGAPNLFLRTLETSAEEQIVSDTVPLIPEDWSLDNKWILYHRATQQTGRDLWLVPVTGDRQPRPFLTTDAEEWNARFSPDSAWVAFASNEVGTQEIFVAPVQGLGAKTRISVGGGTAPRWRRDGKELYFLSLVSLGSMMASEIKVAGSSVQRDVPRVLFQSVFMSTGHAAGHYHAFAVASNGQQFLIPQPESLGAAFGGRGGGTTVNAISAALPAVMADRNGAAGSGSSSSAPITVVVDWTAALKK